MAISITKSLMQQVDSEILSVQLDVQNQFSRIISSIDTIRGDNWDDELSRYFFANFDDFAGNFENVVSRLGDLSVKLQNVIRNYDATDREEML